MMSDKTWGTDPDDGDVLELTRLRNLPADQAQLFAYIVRKARVSYQQIREDWEQWSGGNEAIARTLDAMLDELLKLQYITELDLGQGSGFRPQMRRKATKSPALRGIWNALDFAEGKRQADVVEPEIRRTRSSLANTVLAKLDEDLQGSKPAHKPQPTSPESQTLLSDLLSTGRSSMAKRNIASED